jgi:hypothetical protein
MKKLKERYEADVEALKEIQTKLKPSKQLAIACGLSDDGMDDDDDSDYLTQDDYAYINQRINALWDSLARYQQWTAQRMNQHEQGHLPPIKGPAAMTKALKTLGLDGDYDVAKQTIYASDGTVERHLLTVTKGK